MRTVSRRLRQSWNFARLCLRFLGRRGDEAVQCELAEKVTRLIYPRYAFSDYGRLIQYDDAFMAEYLRFGPGTRSLDRKYVVWQMMQLALGVPGDSAECGVYRGATSYFMCKRLAGSGKTHHVFDSFEGLSEPGEADGSHWSRGALPCGEDAVRANLRAFPFVRYHKGWIPERFGDVRDCRFCFVHIDVDLYQPTRDSAAFFYERLAGGGVLLCDDYGFLTCPGARRAMDEVLADKPERPVLLPTGQAFVIKG